LFECKSIPQYSFMSWPLTVGVRAFSLPLPERKIILSGSWDWLMIIRVKTIYI